VYPELYGRVAETRSGSARARAATSSPFLLAVRPIQSTGGVRPAPRSLARLRCTPRARRPERGVRERPSLHPRLGKVEGCSVLECGMVCGLPAYKVMVVLYVLGRAFSSEDGKQGDLA